MGFSASWLALREPADHAARDAGLLAAAVRAAGAAPLIVDLGSGTGSTIRAFAAHQARPAAWRLVDHDPALLAHAAQAAQGSVTTHQLDLRDLQSVPLDGVTLVTASALLDLCARDWVSRLADRLAARGLPFYAALNYDGVMQWTPADGSDDPVTDAFNRHQRGDKGFGPALGPDAAEAIAEVFQAAGFTVTRADSPWRLGPPEADLQRELLTGIASAATEAGADAEQWLQTRLDALGTARCHIGHVDILALPPGMA